MDLVTLLKHPLVLIATSAFISSIIIPRITNSWQDHKKEFEIKINLTSRMSETIAELLSTSTYLDESKNLEEINKKHEEWIIKASVIRSNIYTYFPNSSISEKWSEYLNMLNYFFTLTLNLYPPKTVPAEMTKDISEEISIFPNYFKDAGIDWQKFSTDDNTDVWKKLRTQLLRKGDQIILDVMNHPLTLFKTKSRRFWKK